MKHVTINTKLCAILGAFSGLIGSASAASTLLVDFHGNDNMGLTTSAASDFAANDADIDAMATVNFIDADAGTPVGGSVITGVGIGANLTIDAGSGFNPPGGPFTGDAILGDYLFNGGGNDPAFTLTGLADDLLAGSVVTLVVYSHGDQAAQIADIGLTVGSQTELLSDVTSEANPFVTFTFVADGSDTLTIRADNADEGNGFAAINGFSLTFDPVPEPSSALLLGLGALGFLGRRRRA